MTDVTDLDELNLERIDQLDRIRRLEFLVQHLDRQLAWVMRTVVVNPGTASECPLGDLPR